jgi:hypothetical protein
LPNPIDSFSNFSFVYSTFTGFTAPYNFHYFRSNLAPWEFPLQTKLKFSSTSANPNTVFTFGSSNTFNYSTTAGFFSINFSSAVANPLAATDKFYSLDDMGMLFTWDTGPAPTINIKENYYTIGGLFAEGRSGNLSGANVTIGGDVIAYHSNSSLAGFTKLNGSKISVRGIGSGSGGSVNVRGRVSQCSILTYAQSYNGVSGNVQVGSFDGRLYVFGENDNNFDDAPIYGNFIATQGLNYVSGITSPTGNGGNFRCEGDFLGMAILTYGGSGGYGAGNAGSVYVGGDCRVGTIDAQAGNGDSGYSSGLTSDFYIGGNIYCNYVRMCQSSEVKAFNGGANILFDANLTQAVFNSDVSCFTIRYSASFSTSSISGTSNNNQARIIAIQGNVDNCASLTAAKFGTNSNNAYIRIAGNVTSSGVSCSILDANDDNSQAGSIQIVGDAINSNLSAIGGSTSSFDLGGNGGSIEVRGNAVRCLISCFGAERFTNSAEPKGSGNGGNVTVYGSAIESPIKANGGRLRGTLGSGRSGSGGSITVYGDFTCNGQSFATVGLNVSGGERQSGQASGIAGEGGTIEIYGRCVTAFQINASGGNNVTGSAASLCGQVRFDSGGDIATLLIIDGSGTGTLTFPRYIIFNGHFNIKTWNIANRSGIRIVSGRTISGSLLTNYKNAYIICTARTGQIQLTKQNLSLTTTLASTDWITFYDGVNWYTQAYTGPKA